MKPSKLGLLFLAISGLFWTSCQSHQQNSVLVFAFEQLSAEDLNCSEELTTSDSGLGLLCKESVRFTHAFTTSLQPAAAMASLLTATYPIQHGLRTSGDRINPQIDLLSDQALKKNYRTGFFSGGPTILKKTGLSRSFEIFDDTIASQDNRFAWSMSSLLNQMSEWIFEVNSPFLTVVYFSNTDINQPLTDEDDEKLFAFFEMLKRKKIWDTSHIILTGLKGQNKYSRVAETAFSNLHSENTNIAFLYKPPRQKGDDGINWKSDNLISLADIGHSLFCLVEDCSLMNQKILHSTELEWLQTHEIQTAGPEQKMLMVEAPNPFEYSQIKYAMRTKTGLFLNSPRPQYFNTLSDRSETIDNYDSKKGDGLVSATVLQKILDNSAATRNLKWGDYKQFKVVQNNLNYWQQPLQRQSIIDQTTEKTDPLFALNVNTEINKSFVGASCLRILKKNTVSHDDLKFCDDDLLLAAIRLKHSRELNLNRKNMEANFELEKRMQANAIMRASKNISLENAWGLHRTHHDWDLSYKYLGNLAL